jgi:hypothetical protein
MTPTLYCLMRQDLQDLNPGKGMAQAMHAQADFDQWINDKLVSSPAYKPYIAEWKEDRSFGRTLVLECTLEEISNVANYGAAVKLPMALTIDPTYPWRNFYGKVFLSEEVTCGWVFACDLTPQPVLDELRKLSLHR